VGGSPAGLLSNRKSIVDRDMVVDSRVWFAVP
jgi:hypothetical protein